MGKAKQAQAQEGVRGNMDTDTNLDQHHQHHHQAVTIIHYRAVDQERTVVLSCMDDDDTHLEAVYIHKAAEEEGKGMDKENSLALSLMMEEPLELVVMKMMLLPPPPQPLLLLLLLLWMIWKMTFALCPMVHWQVVVVVRRENTDKVACRKERACNKDTDKDTEDIHKVRKIQGEQEELNL